MPQATIAFMPSRLAVCPFTIVVDTREQAPYQFQNMPHSREKDARLVVKIIREGLTVGDYSLPSYTGQIAIERKSLEDLYGTLSAGRDRFERELARLARREFAAVVIEADWATVCNPAAHRDNWRSRVPPQSVTGTILAWMQPREGRVAFPRVHWFFAGSRRAAEVATFRMLERFWRDRQ